MNDELVFDPAEVEAAAKLSFRKIGEVYTQDKLAILRLESLGDVNRRRLRNLLFQICLGNDGSDLEPLKSYISSQFLPFMNWPGFTFVWDVAPNDPLKVISMGEWEMYGGRWKRDRIGVYRVPTGFTEQVIEVNGTD